MKTFDFQLFFRDADTGTETLLSGWEEGSGENAPILRSRTLGDLRCFVWSPAPGTYTVKVVNFTDEIRTGWWSIRWKWQFNEAGYTLVPGIFYQGNHQAIQFPVPELHPPGKKIFQSTLAAAAFPGVFTMDSSGRGVCRIISPITQAGFNGIELDAENGTMSFYMPAREDKIYRHARTDPYGRAPFALEPHRTLTFTVEEERFSAPDKPALFHFFREKRFRWQQAHPEEERPMKIPLQQAAELVGKWITDHHFVRGEHGEPMFLNAFTGTYRKPEPVREYAYWNIYIGWCSGPMTALPLLKLSEDARKKATEYLNFLCRKGFFESGLKKPVFDGHEWVSLQVDDEAKTHEHARMYGDFAYYLARAIGYEEEQGRKHPQWEKVFHEQIRIFLDLWKKEGDFGIWWDTTKKELSVRRRGTAAGVFPALALTEALKLEKENEELQRLVPEILLFYADRCLRSGRCWGGPLDILETDDSESCTALTNALTLYATMHPEDGRFLPLAVQAAEMLTSWIMAYRPPFPPGSSLDGLDFKGGILANVKNHHIGPGFCTNSGKFLYDLFRLTGDERWKQLYFEVGKAAVSAICTDPYEFVGMDEEKNMVFFAPGMVSEQINAADALLCPGETWCVSASWPATANLLYWFDFPVSQERS